MKLYQIAWGAQDEDSHPVTFATEAARDATWDAIQAIPWQEGTARQKRSFPGYASRAVKLDGFNFREVRGHGILGTIYRTSTNVHDAPLPVEDVTDRSGEDW